MKNLPLILLVLLVAYVVFATRVGDSIKSAIGMGPVMGQSEMPQHYPKIDLGMYDAPNPDAFGTTEEADRRITNDGVRKEYHKNPFPWAECGDCAAGTCDKHGVPDPAPGHTHVCKNGFPSKRVIDSYGGWFQLNHMCAPGVDEGCGAGEPPALGRWWARKGCSCPESIGLNVRAACTRCG